jgi:hypothetical protein
MTKHTKLVLNYVLDEHKNPVPEPDIMKWSDFWTSHRFMADETHEGVRVATIFLGLEDCLGPGIFFESTVFGGKHDMRRSQYKTYTEAMAGHARLVELVKTDRE